ncbi:MAG: glycosyltransferase, partial [Actinomycetota bacterium]
GVADAVVFAGFREDRLRVVRTFDVFAMASVHEGLPLALLEAMALGCPPVATRVGGVNAVIGDGVNGFVVEPRDPEAQADRIVSLLEDASLRSRLGAAARERATAFDVRAALRRIEHVYTELVG